MPLSEDERKSYDLAAEVSKQIITLSTTIITVSIAFAGSKWQGNPSLLAAISWILFLAAIFFSLWTLSSLTGSINQGQANINKANIAIPASMQSICFLAALICAGIFGYKSMGQVAEKEKAERIIIENRIIHKKCSECRIDTIIHERG